VRKKNPDLMYHTFPNLGQNINTKDRFGQFQVQDRRKLWEITLKMGIVIYIISGIKAILQDSSVKIADDEGVSPSSSVTHEFPVICFSPRVMYNVKFDIYKNIF
jgi:hypothetical protein